MKKIVLCVLVSLLVVSLAWATEKVPVIRTTIKAPAYTPNKDDVLNEGFEGGVLPTGWTQEYVVGAVDWAYDNGGHSGHPSSAHTGSYNALFYDASYDGNTTKLITPEIDLSAKTDYSLTFWHAQVDWGGDQDSLKVYYKTSAAGAWTLLEEYTTSVLTWTERTIDLPNPCSTYYIAFEGSQNYGYGVCIDDVIVAEAAPPGQSEVYGWEDGVATALGFYGNAVFENSTEQAYEGTHSLKYTEDPIGGTPQAYIWWVTGLTDGDVIDASFWVYDFNDVDSYPKGRIWAHYTSDPEDINTYAGSASGNSDYSVLGWSQLSYSWTFDSDGGARDGFVVEARIYSSSTPGENVLYIDSTDITVSSDTAIIYHPSPPTRDIVVTVTVDNYPSEASWNVWDYTNLSWYYPANQTFTTSGETQIDTLALADGNYAVYCWDTYGDGGISGIVTNMGVVLIQWASTDYTDEGIFDFLVYQLEYGSLAGYVTEFSVKTPIEGANIVCGVYEGFSGPDGYYQIDDILVGTYDVTCEAEGFNVALVEDIEITVDDTTYQDFALTAPTMDIDDTPIVVEVLMNSTNDENFITIENNGNGPLDWIAIVEEPGKQLVSIPPATGGYPRGPYEVSSEEVPANLRPSHEANQPSFTLLRGSIGYGYEALSGGVVWLDTDVPDVLNTIFTPSWVSYAGEYGIDNETHMYYQDKDTYDLLYVDMTTGDTSIIGPTGLSASMNDMACDKITGTMYALCSNVIYTVDLATGACTVVGPINNTGGLMIGIAIDGNGDMWGHDLGLDEIWYIDKTTGAGTSVGSTGFDANYAQSMAWDPETDIVYLAAFNNSNFFYELRIVDLFTGGTALVGGIYYTEITAFSFPGSAGPSWLTLNPFSGTIPPGGSCLSNVIFDATGIDPGTTLNADIIFTSDPDVGSVSVPAEMTVYFPENYVLEGFEDPEFPPFDWINTDGYWRRFTNNAYQGDGYARVNWTHPRDANLISPFLNIASGDIISFYWINANLYDTKLERIIGEDTLFVEISNDIFDPDGWETLIALSAEEEMEEYEEVMVYLPDAYIGNQARVRWRHRTYESAESRGIGLDNILMPEPFYPINFYLDPEEQADYDSFGATVEYSIDVYNTGIQSDRYNLSIIDSTCRRDVLLEEGFESAVPPTGWTQIYEYGSIDWIQSPEGHSGNPPSAYEGEYLALFYSSGYDGYTTKLVTPEISFADSKDGELTFWHFMQNWVGDQDELRIYYKNSPTGDWVLIEEYTTDVSVWTQRTITLPNTSSTYYIAFEGFANYGYGVCIDDVQVTGAGGGPGPGPTGWPASVSVPYIDVNPGEFGTFSVLVEIPEDAVEDDVNTTTVLVESREAPHISHEADVITTAHPKDPYEPNDNFADATPIDYGFVSDGAQIYYNAYYFDKDIDIYTFDGLEGDVIYTLFDVADTVSFDGAIVLLDADSTMLAYADSYAGGVSEALQYRLLNDGTFYVKLGVWYDVLMGPFKKTIQRTETTTYYTMSLELIPSPDVLVEPEELTLGIIQNGKDIASDILYITNTGDEGAINLDWDIEVVIPGFVTYLDEGFEGTWPPTDWTIIQGPGSPINDIIQTSDQAHSGTYSARFSSYYTASSYDEYLITPEVNTSAGDLLSFWYRKYSYGTELFKVGWSSTGTDISTDFTWGPEISDASTTWQQYIKTDLPVGTKYVAIHYYSNYQYYLYVDDVNMSTGTPWVTVEPPTGSVPQGATRTTTITCDDDAKGLDPGTYYADIIVHNNALLYGVSDVIVPLTLYVGESSGGLEGTVTFITTGEPIDSVKVSCGGFVAYTDSNGFYQFDPAPPVGTYNVKFEKPGFVTAYAPDVELGYWITVLPMQMYFDGPRPRDLVAEGLHLCIDLTWRAPELGGVGDYTQAFHDGTFESQLGCGGACGLGVRFTPVAYPADLTHLEMTFQGDANCTAAIVSVYLDPDGLIQGPPAAPTGPGDPSAIWESGPMSFPPGTYQIDLSTGVTINAGDAYVIVWENSSGFLGVANDLQMNYIDRNWGYTSGAWSTIYAATGGNPALTGNFGITATFHGALGDYLAGFEPVFVEKSSSEYSEMLKQRINNGTSVEGLLRSSIPGFFEINMNSIGNRDKVNLNTVSRDLILEGYKLYREDVTTGPIAYIPIEDPRYYRDDIVEAYVEYTYWVTAIYTVGESGHSNHASAIPICLNIEDFELDDGGYTSNDPAGWQWGHATAGPPNAHSGENLWGTVLNGNYIDNASWTLDAPEIDITSANCLLRFFHWYNTENSYDGGNVKISIDGGTIWTVIIPEGGYPDDSITGLGGEPGYTANSGGWVPAAFDLVDYIGETASFRWHFGTDSSVHGYPGWYIDDVIIGLGPPPDYGALEGIVTDGYGEPIEDAIITAMGYMHPFERYSVETNEDGYYVIDPIIAQFYNFTCEAEGFVTFTDTFTVLPDETYIEDVIMGNPILRVEPDSIVVILDPDQQETRDITVFNDGNAELIWDAVIEFLDLDFTTNRFESVTATSTNSEVDPNQTTPYNPPSKDMWDILFAYDVDGPSGLAGLVSAETDGSYLYTTKWSGSGEIAKFDLEGNYIETFYISGVTNLRDLAYDGTYFYGSDASARIWQMDFDAQTLISTIPCPVAVRSIAYDDDNDAFWVNNWSEDIKLVDRSGNVLNTIPAPPSLYGSAYDNISDGGPYLWIFTGTSTGGGCQVEQYDLNTLALTGVGHSVSGDFPGTIAGGLFTSGDIVPGIWILGGLAQGSPDILFGYELGETTPPWLIIEPDHGIVDSFGSQQVSAIFNSAELPLGTILTANVHFIPNVGEEDTLFAKLLVSPPDLGNLEGTVTDTDSGPIEGALITATSQGKLEYTDTTDVNGYYLIEDMNVGTYIVTCEESSHNTPPPETVLIEVDQTTTQDFVMTAPELIFTPSNFEFVIVEGYSDTDTLYVENIGTGPVDFFIDIDYITDTRQTTILCVDRDGSSAAGYTDDWPYFEAALIASGYTNYTYYEVVDMTEDGPDLATMQAYEVIIWFSGEAWGYYGHDCMTDNDEMNLGIYLEGGGSLFLSAQDYLWASYPSAGAFSLGQFPYDYLGLRSVAQDNWLISLPSTGIVAGADSSLAEGYIFDIQDIYTTDKEGLYIDWITDHVGLDLFNVISPTPEGICANQYDSDLFRTVFTTASFAAITEPTIQDSLIKDIIIYLTSGIPPWLTVEPMSGTFPTTITELLVTADTEDLPLGDHYATITVNTENPDIGETVIPVHLEVVEIGVEEIHILSTKLNSNFPNPFSNSTTISFSLKEKTHVKLSVYNIKGQLVATLIDDMMNPVANHEIIWNGKNGRKQLANGIYFYKFDTKQKSFIKKMILMR